MSANSSKKKRAPLSTEEVMEMLEAVFAHCCSGEIDGASAREAAAAGRSGSRQKGSAAIAAAGAAAVDRKKYSVSAEYAAAQREKIEKEGETLLSSLCELRSVLIQLCGSVEIGSEVEASASATGMLQ